MVSAMSSILAMLGVVCMAGDGGEGRSFGNNQSWSGSCMLGPEKSVGPLEVAARRNKGRCRAGSGRGRSLSVGEAGRAERAERGPPNTAGGGGSRPFPFDRNNQIVKWRSAIFGTRRRLSHDSQYLTIHRRERGVNFPAAG